VTQTVGRPPVGATPPVGTAPGRTLGQRLRETVAGSDRFWGWAGPLLVALVGGVLRFADLDRPHKLVFDEVYYVKAGVAYLRSGYDLATLSVTPGTADPFVRGTTDVFAGRADFAVHLSVGK
jgi:dolichyl-phosphate-mannose-protein mannosyltransferase